MTRIRRLIMATALCLGGGFGRLSNAAAQPSTKPAACAQTLWGCPQRMSDGEAAGGKAQRYLRLVNLARGSDGTLRATTPAELDAAARHLSEAIELEPSAPEAYSLLGQVELERGQLEPAAAALQRAEELLIASGPIERSDPQLALALGLLAALEGDLNGALERDLRLLRIGAPSHRLLYRTADVMMALGRLEEATALFDRACAMARGYDTPLLDLPRACHGLLVALDRGERARAAQTARRLRQLDREGRVLRYNDFLTVWEREYHLALGLPPSCERLQALQHYLRGAKDSTKATGTAPQNPAPLSYIRRAETHVKELSAFICPTS